MFAELMNYIVDKKVDVRETITGLTELLIKWHWDNYFRKWFDKSIQPQ